MADTATTIPATTWRERLSGRAGIRHEEAAEVIGSHVNTVKRLVRAGELTQYHVGRHPRVTTESLIAFLERGGRVGATRP